MKRNLNAGFTLVEMLMVMLIIAILAGLVLGLNGLVQAKAARARAQGEIATFSSSCETYKNDFGTYPRSDGTPNGNPCSLLKTEGAVSGTPPSQGTVPLDPTKMGNPTNIAYKNSSLYLYTQLSGDFNYNGIRDNYTNPTGANTLEPAGYFQFNANQLGKNASTGAIAYIQDPYGNSYGYSTAAATDEECFQAAVKAGNASATRANPPHGFNSTFDLWSTGGRTTDPVSGNGDSNSVWARWVKNW